MATTPTDGKPDAEGALSIDLPVDTPAVSSAESPERPTAGVTPGDASDAPLEDDAVVTHKRGVRVLRDGRVLRWWVEALTVLGFYTVYTLIRHSSEGSTAEAYKHAMSLIDLEKSLHIFHEQQLQEWALNFRPLIIAMNYFYGSLHFIVTAGVIVFLFRKHPEHYPRWRNIFALCTAGALIGFVTWPLMPPRLLPTEWGFVDTLAKYPTFWTFNSGTMSKVSNQYAAMPSLHFAWSSWCMFASVPFLKTTRARLLMMSYPLWTLTAIVLTGNHYFLDAAGGAVLFIAAFVIGTLWSRWWAKHSPTVTAHGPSAADQIAD
ncbi:MAG: phosphatase PAP2 family protein [Acidimicrobiia bacterium]|nr:phosphatase PAP2 family protein [Acidimicrobiia bacterium]